MNIKSIVLFGTAVIVIATVGSLKIQQFINEREKAQQEQIRQVQAGKEKQQESCVEELRKMVSMKIAVGGSCEDGNMTDLMFSGTVLLN